MAESPAALSRCSTCGTDLSCEGAACPTCLAPDTAAAAVEAALVPAAHQTSGADCAPGPLWARLLVAVVYVAAGALCAYGSFSFFHGAVALSDYFFGAMAFGLVLVALLGVKESLFPSRWTPE